MPSPLSNKAWKRVHYTIHWNIHWNMTWRSWPAKSDEIDPPFEGTFDYVFYGVELQTVRAPLTKEQRALVDEQGERFPCEWHMSDHLPVAACFRFK